MNNYNASSIAVGRFLSDESQQFVIPDYQRRYAWEEKQVLDLFYDINYLNEQQYHLLGMTLSIRESEGYPSIISIVDGQQRITTLLLTIKVLHDHYKSIGGDKFLTAIRSCLFAKKNDGSESPKIIHGKLDRLDFEKLINQNEINENTKTSNLSAAYYCLKERIEKFDIEKVEEFWRKLFTTVTIIDYKLDKNTDAYKIFEITNNRGLALTKTDIIKSFILGHISIIVDIKGESNRLNSILDKWQKIITNLDGIKKDEFFRHFLMSKINKKISFNKLIEFFKSYYFNNIKEVELLTEYKRHMHDKSKVKSSESPSQKNQIVRRTIEGFLDDLNEASIIYKNITNADFDDKKINLEIKDLNRVEAKPAYTFLLHTFSDKKIKTKEKLKIINFLQIFMLRRQINKSATGELDDFFSKLCGYNGENYITNVKEEIEIRAPGFYPADEEFIKKFAEFDFSTNRAKYVLSKIENYLSPLGEKIINWDLVQLEHIIPQKINNVKYGDWVNYLGKGIDEHKKVLNTIGNLTLLKDRLNLDASNNSFNDKKKQYGRSTFLITKKLSKKQSFKIKDTLLRSKQFANYAVKIWSKDF